MVILLMLLKYKNKHNLYQCSLTVIIKKSLILNLIEIITTKIVLII